MPQGARGIFTTMTDHITEFEFVTNVLKQYYKLAKLAYISGGAFKVEFIISPNRMLYLRTYSPAPIEESGWKMADHFDVNLGHAEALSWNLAKLEEFVGTITSKYRNKS